jgi:hypothetical protein
MSFWTFLIVNDLIYCLASYYETIKQFKEKLSKPALLFRGRSHLPDFAYVGDPRRKIINLILVAAN